MLNKRKTIRDIVIIVVIVVGAYFMLRARQPGPVEQGQSPTPSSSEASSLPAGHMQARPALSDGDPVATVGDKTIGKTWFDWAVAQQKADEASQKGMDPAMADKFSQLAALVEGLNEIIVAQAVLDFKLEPAMAAAEKQFDSQFEDQKAEGDFLSSQHMTKDRLKGLWAGNAVAGKIAEMKGIDASNESQVKQAFADWINERLGQLNVVFTDTARETLFKGYLEQMRSNAAGQTSGTESEGMMMGHGDMPTSTGQ